MSALLLALVCLALSVALARPVQRQLERDRFPVVYVTLTLRADVTEFQRAMGTAAVQAANLNEGFRVLAESMDRTRRLYMPRASAEWSSSAP